jgi:hypothetical protein
MVILCLPNLFKEIQEGILELSCYGLVLSASCQWVHEGRTYGQLMFSTVSAKEHQDMRLVVCELWDELTQVPEPM